MTAVLGMASITECSVVGCSYNDHSGCNAFAVTIGGSGASAECATFIPLSAKGGLSKVVGHVGACQRADCVHTSHWNVRPRRCGSARARTPLTA